MSEETDNANTPTPAEIAAECAAIQATWSRADRIGRIVDDEHRRIAGGRWFAPTVRGMIDVPD